MRVVLVGCGHAQLSLLCAASPLVDAQHRVVVINPSNHLYYPGMSPGYLSGTYDKDHLKVHVAALAQKCGATFMRTTVRSIDIAARVISTDAGPISYDVASINIGSKTTLSGFSHIDREALYSSISPRSLVSFHCG